MVLIATELRRSSVAVAVLAIATVALISFLFMFRVVSGPIPRSDDDLPLLDKASVSSDREEYSLEVVLADACMEDKTVILTTLNEAWVARDSIIDLFLESFRIGERTRRLLDHLVIVCLDQKAFSRCVAVHAHCIVLVSEGTDFSREAYFMTPDYLKLMWRRIDFLRSVLEMGYNFVFTDADVMWFRDPFPHFDEDADFQIACDHFSGIPDDIENKPNGGFNFVRSNNRSIDFYKYWYSSRETYPGLHDQDVLNKIKNDSFIMEIGLKMRFLDTAYFGGFCEPSENLNLVCTMHANCCFGLNSKLHDLRILLEDWKRFLSVPPVLKSSLQHGGFLRIAVLMLCYWKHNHPTLQLQMAIDGVLFILLRSFHGQQHFQLQIVGYHTSWRLLPPIYFLENIT